MIKELIKYFLTALKNSLKDSLKYIVFYFVYLKLKLLSKFIKKENKNLYFTNPKIALFYYIPKEHSRYGKWHDGFTLAITELQKKFDISLINIEDVDDINETTLKFDIVLIKASWGDKTETLIRKSIKNIENKYIGFFISGSNSPLSLEQLYFYDILFYETSWYQKFISMHPLSFKAFGVNHNEKKLTHYSEKIYDYIMYGELKFYKNYHAIFLKKGKRIVIGDYSSDEGSFIKEILEYFGVEVLPYMGFDNLSSYLSKSKTLLIPTYYYGGGERVLLETKYSTDVSIEYNPSNKKLLELDNSFEILDYKHYAKEIENGLTKLMKGKDDK